MHWDKVSALTDLAILAILIVWSIMDRYNIYLG